MPPEEVPLVDPPVSTSKGIVLKDIVMPSKEVAYTDTPVSIL